MDVKPANNQILCEATPMKLPGDLITPNHANGGGCYHMTVLAVGPGKLLDSGQRAPIPFNVGDRVLIHELAQKGGRVQMLNAMLSGGRTLILVDAGDIIGTTTGDIELPPPAIVTPGNRRTRELVH